MYWELASKHLMSCRWQFVYNVVYFVGEFQVRGKITEPKGQQSGSENLHGDKSTRGAAGSGPREALIMPRASTWQRGQNIPHVKTTFARLLKRKTFKRPCSKFQLIVPCNKGALLNNNGHHYYSSTPC